MLIFIVIVGGIAVVLLFVETVIPQLRGSVTLERDLEHPSGRTVGLLLVCTFCALKIYGHIAEAILFARLYCVDARRMFIS